jgi:hypothetical protein
MTRLQLALFEKDDALPFEPNIGVPIITMNYPCVTNVWHCGSWTKGSSAALRLAAVERGVQIRIEQRIAATRFHYVISPNR